MLAIFENYSKTKDNSKLSPILVKKSPLLLLDFLTDYLTNEGYENIEVNRGFCEIYCDDFDFEISIFINQAEEGSGSIVNLAVYSETKRGRTRRKLKNFYKEISALF